MTTYITLPVGASPYWGNSVATSTDLAAVGTTVGEIVFVLDTESLYYWDGASWVELLDGVADMSGPGSSTDNALALFDGVTGKVLKAASAITASRALASDASGVPVAVATTDVELGYVNGVTSAIQTQLDGKEPTITVLPVAKGGTNSGTALNNNRVMTSSGGAVVEATAITASRALESDGSGIPVASATTATELGYVAGLTGPVQNQINQTKSANSTGILTGGALTINGGDPALLDIASGTGIIADHATTPPTITTVTWTTKTGVTLTNLATSFATDIAINAAGNVVQQNSFTNSELRDLIFLGGVDHSNQTTINNTFSVQVPAFDAGLSARDLALAVGDLNVSGNVISANGANLSINKSAGTTFAFGRNTITDITNPHNVSQASDTAASFNYVFSNGSGGSTFSASTSSINPASYDNGSGTLAAVTSNRWTIQRILMFSNTGNLFVQYGTAEYLKKEDALEAVGPSTFTNLPGIRTAVVRCYLVVKQGATVLNSSSSAVFVEADKFGNIAGVGLSNVAITNEDNTFTGTNAFNGTTTFNTPTMTLDANGVMSLIATTAYFRPPALTTVQRDALTAVEGALIFNTTDSRFQGYFSGAWASLHGWGS